MKGTILSFEPRRGFGFLTVGNGEEDVFFHRSALEDSVRHRKIEDAPCEFEWGERNGRKIAVNVRPLASNSESTAENFVDSGVRQ